MTLLTDRESPGSAQPVEREERPTPPEREGERPAAERADGPNPGRDAELKRIKDLPPEVGVMLLTVGALGFVLPGVVGTPAVIAGGLVLWPRRFEKIENWFERRFPDLHRKSLHQIHRYLDDLEKRYPTES